MISWFNVKVDCNEWYYVTADIMLILMNDPTLLSWLYFMIQWYLYSVDDNEWQCNYRCKPDTKDTMLLHMLSWY